MKDLQTAWSCVEGQMIVVGTHSVPWSHYNREKILAAITAKDFALAQELMAPTTIPVGYGNGQVKLVDGQVYYRGKIVSPALHARLLMTITLGLPVQNLLSFIDRLEENPNFRVREVLLDFLDFGQLPLTEDGCFIARKVVQDDYWSVYTNSKGEKIFWGVGAKPVMPLREVDNDPNRTCSSGLHVYNRDYGKMFAYSGCRVLAVKVDPRAVVSIPTDYNNTKMRVWSDGTLVEVIGELKEEDDPEFFSQLVWPPVDVDEWEDEEDYDEEPEEVCSNCGRDIMDCDRGCWAYCPLCGESIDNDCIKFCSECGAELKEIVLEDEQVFCCCCGEEL